MVERENGFSPESGKTTNRVSFSLSNQQYGWEASVYRQALLGCDKRSRDSQTHVGTERIGRQPGRRKMSGTQIYFERDAYSI